MKNSDVEQAGDDGFHLRLNKNERTGLWQTLAEDFERMIAGTCTNVVYDEKSQSVVDEALASLDLGKPHKPHDALRLVNDALARFQLNTSHPRYFGVFNPTPSSMGIIGEAIAAFFNPQLASSVSSKWCVGIEKRLLHFFGERFGFAASTIDGNFTSGATEANYTALLCALSHYLPLWQEHGLVHVAQKHVIYCTRETHHSIARAARVVGLGSASLRIIDVDADLQFDCAMLKSEIERDLSDGRRPLFVVATLGSTSAGVVDPIATIADLAQHYGLWFHVDAAWGGAIALLDEHGALINGLSRADSIAFDPHKWLSVPMGCGMFITRHRGILRRTFDVEESPYMPMAAREANSFEPYRESLQWSRRFIGLKLFMTLYVHGVEGYQNVLRHQIRMGERLREKLAAHDWIIKNKTPLPVVCFVDRHGVPPEQVRRIVNSSTRAFLTTTQLSYGNVQVLRAGISSFLTRENDVDELVNVLNEARRGEGAGTENQCPK